MNVRSDATHFNSTQCHCFSPNQIDWHIWTGSDGIVPVTRWVAFDDNVQWRPVPTSDKKGDFIAHSSPPTSVQTTLCPAMISSRWAPVFFDCCLWRPNWSTVIETDTQICVICFLLDFVSKQTLVDRLHSYIRTTWLLWWKKQCQPTKPSKSVSVHQTIKSEQCWFWSKRALWIRELFDE